MREQGIGVRRRGGTQEKNAGETLRRMNVGGTRRGRHEGGNTQGETRRGGHAGRETDKIEREMMRVFIPSEE